MRHPEKRHKQHDKKARHHPPWLRVAAMRQDDERAMRRITAPLGLHTICEEGACPNRAHCWHQRHATFLLMGAVCTRGCAFCHVSTGRPHSLDADEPVRVAQGVLQLGLRHVVLTSVNRDDLPDGGASHYAATIDAIRKRCHDVTVEVLTPDFLHSVETVVAARPDVFNHNIETVARLYRTVRPGARYHRSLRLLARVKELSPSMMTKSGVMVGLGESDDELRHLMDDLRQVGVDILTIGQYLAPTPYHAPVSRMVSPKQFDVYRRWGMEKGFGLVAAAPLVRSSFHAEEDFKRLTTRAASKLYDASALS